MPRKGLNRPGVKHDTLFKWLIQLFCDDFFDYFFPNQGVEQIRFLDKEFLDKYKGPKKWLEGDMLFLAEVTTHEGPIEVAICLEHKSWKKDVADQLSEYFHHLCLMGLSPVWCIALFTDPAKWRVPLENKKLLGYAAGSGRFYLHYDIIKLTNILSSQLLA